MLLFIPSHEEILEIYLALFLRSRYREFLVPYRIFFCFFQRKYFDKVLMPTCCSSAVLGIKKQQHMI